MTSLAYVAIISTSVQGFMLGFAVFTTGLTIFMLVRDRRRRSINYGMIAASCTLLALSVGEFAIDIDRLVRGFVTVGPYQPGGTWLFFYSVTDYTFIVKACLYPVQILILDGVVIYRAYVAWQSLLAVLIPCVGWCGLLASAIGLIYSMATIPQYPEAVYLTRNPPWIYALYCATLATNFTATALLAFRIWRVNHRASEFQRSYSRLRILFRVVIESGLVYTVLNLALLIAFRTNSIAVFYLRDMLSPTIPIVFNMILIRVGFSSGRGLSVLGVEVTNAVSTVDLQWRFAPHTINDRHTVVGRKSVVLDLSGSVGGVHGSELLTSKVKDPEALHLEEESLVIAGKAVMGE
ncbi:hypothetical protein EIP91_008836 [Steccherinum ochraceum]|uniref:G-protein coupled receptors family 1 profile domain-containing protein n=1 Tax=Steccherinum ochraceum TaxID=92696 RepID=A0A4R0R4K4_9APHY|nr:hypothetical protein EIP91_008836 [Steccherinum ochraceum]